MLRRLLILWPAALALLAGTARAQEVHEVQPAGDTVVGVLDEAGAVERIPFRAVEGTVLGFKVKAGKGSALRPHVRLLGVDRAPDTAADDRIKASRKGNLVKMAKHVVADTGLHWLEIGGLEGSTGEWQLAFKVKPPRKASRDIAVGDSGTVDLEFVAPGNAVGRLKVGAARKSAALPAFDALIGPDGLPILIDEVRVQRKGFELRDVALARGGRYVLRVRETAAAAGDLVLKATFKVAKAFKRTLDIDQIITDPVVLGLEPQGGDTSQVLPAVVDVDFARPGAVVVFRNGATIVTVPASAVVVDDDSATFSLNLAPFQAGVYDVEVVNPDGGRGLLEDAFTIVNAAAVPLAVTPDSGRDNEIIRLTVSGERFMSAATLRLLRGEESIEGTNVSGAGGLISADFDLRDRALGRWDLEVVNPGAESAVLASAFEIRSDPFELHAMTPGDNLDGETVVATVTGLGFTEGMLVALVPGDSSGDAPIAGTDVTVEESGELQVSFATAGAPVRTWDLVVRHPDQRELTLQDVFETRGALGKSALAASVQATADGPVAVTWNETRKEYLVVWMEENPFGIIVQWNVWGLRLDSTGQAIGKPVNVTLNSPLSEKRTVAAGWDPTHDQYLVAWAERRTVKLSSNGQKHPNGAGAVPIDQIFAQRLAGSDLSAAGKPVQVSTHTQFPAASKTVWYLDEFHNFRPSVAYDRAADKWVVAWMQEFDTSGVQAADDFNVAQRTMDPVTDVLGGIVELGSSTWHEGDPHVFWDPVDSRVLTVWNARNGSDSAPLDVLLGDGSPGTRVVTGDNGADLADPKAVVDADAERVLLTWTRVPPKSGQRTVHAILIDQTDLSTPIGQAVAVASGKADKVAATPLWNSVTGDAMVTWTEANFSGGTSEVLMRRLRTDGINGLELLGDGTQLSGGKGVEAMASGTVGGEAFTVVWLRTLTPLKGGGYPGSVLPVGTLRGKEVWVQRIK